MSVFYFKPNKGEYMLVDGILVTEGCDYLTEVYDGDIIITADKCAAEPGIRRYLGLSAAVRVREDGVSVFGNLLLTDFGDRYVVSYALEHIDGYAPPEALCQKSVKYAGTEHSVTLYRDSGIRLMCENGKNMYVKDISLPLLSPSLQLQQTSQGLLIALNADTEENGKYLLILMFKSGYAQLFEGAADGIDFNGNAFVMRSLLKDMLGRELLEHYSFVNGAFKKVKSENIYTHNIPYPEALAPCLFLEAVKNGDQTQIKKLFADEVEDASAFSAFFGGFDDFTAVDSNNVPDTYVLISNAKTRGVYRPRRFRFELSDGKITNIFEA